MARTRRQWISQQAGSFHIISRTAGGDVRFSDEEKEYFLNLLERFASGFFVEIHTFCVMGTHFHVQATGLEVEAEKAEAKELFRRYRLIYGQDAEPPVGSYEVDGSVIPDEDAGVERLRQRLGSISRFVQELKQTFSCWYNKRHKRKGYLWGDRFKGVIVDKGEAQLVCSAYIDLNPIRANIVKRPEDYRWSSLGLRVGNPGRAKKLLGVIFESSGESIAGERKMIKTADENDINTLSWYREFVYISGGIAREGKGKIPEELVDEVKRCHGKLGLGDRLGYRVKNISEGLAIGSYGFISSLQEKLKRKFIRPRSFFAGNLLYATRILRV